MTRIAKRLAATILAALLLSGCGRDSTTLKPAAPDSGTSSETQNVTWNDVAPIIHAKCSDCHHEQGSAPFPLLRYADVAKRREQIAEVVQSRYMPPWLPDATGHALQGERRLSDAELETLTAWFGSEHSSVAPETEPLAPTYTSEWMLGDPDLIVEMPSPYVHRSSDIDEWRNFVLPTSLKGTKFVRAYDVIVENPQAVHHAVIQVDSTGRSRRMDEADAGPGFAGMQNGQVRLVGATPDGRILGWLPGKTPYAGDDETAWPLRANDDIVLQLHMPATGKDESLRVRIGLYFADKPPTKQPYSLLLSLRDIDIPAGDDQHVREIEYVLPVDIEMTGLFPHAHYICKEMHVSIKPPGGEAETLLHIPKWDFDWQDDYRFAQPLQLAKGSAIRMRYRYNNSESNEQNPFDPPKRVLYGEQSTDSMGDLILQLTPRSEQDRSELMRDFRRFEYEESLKRRLVAVRNAPDETSNYVLAGEALLLLGRNMDAVKYFRQAIIKGDRDTRTLAKMAAAFKAEKNLPQAIEIQRRASQLSPAEPALRRELAMLYLLNGDAKDAEREFRVLLKATPDDPQLLTNLGITVGQSGNLILAEKNFRAAINVAPNFAAAHTNLGITLTSQGKAEQAVSAFRRAVALDPTNQRAAKLLESTERELARAQND